MTVIELVLLSFSLQGFASGDSEEDAYSIRRFVADGNLIILGQSYAKVRTSMRYSESEHPSLRNVEFVQQFFCKYIQNCSDFKIVMNTSVSIKCFLLIILFSVFIVSFFISNTFPEFRFIR